MKQHILRMISLVLLLVLLVAGSELSAIAEEADRSTSLPSQQASEPVAGGHNHFFGNQLKTDQEKQIYRSMEKILLNSKTHGTGIAVEFESPLSLPEGQSDEELYQYVVSSLQRGADAFKMDHPQMYWITGGSAMVDPLIMVRNDGTRALIKIKIIYEPLVSNYSADDLRINSMVNTIVNEAKKQTDDYAKLKMVHDLLAQNITYDNRDPASPRSFQISGAFVDGRGVCEAYSKAFKICAEKLGFPTVLVAGTGITSSGKIPHMWNYVKVDGKWYAVDTTWDDQKTLVHSYFLVGSDTTSDGTEYSKKHIPEGVFFPVDYKSFSYPKLSQTSYRYDHS